MSVLVAVTALWQIFKIFWLDFQKSKSDLENHPEVILSSWIFLRLGNIIPTTYPGRVFKTLEKSLLPINYIYTRVSSLISCTHFKRLEVQNLLGQ